METFEATNTKQFRISPFIAREKNIPCSFVAAVLVETAKAVYVYGHGATDPTGHCCVCGRTLTHPGSILLGIGPECLGSWSARDIKMNDVTEADKDYLASLVRDQRVDTWLPKGCIKDTMESECQIVPPQDHPMMKPRDEKPKGLNLTPITYQDSGLPGIKITFPYSPGLVAHVKKLQGRRFHGEPKEKYWTCPLTVENLQELLHLGFQAPKELHDWFYKKTTDEVAIGEGIVEITGLKKTLYDFQKDGVAFIERNDGRALIGDEMGLGKTCQALAWLQLHPELRPAIVVVPASLKLNWEREIKMWMSDKAEVQILSGTNSNVPLVGDIIILNYDILAAWLEKLRAVKAPVIITDECHYYKNNQAQRTKAIKELAKGVPHFLALSGTPIVNRPVEFFNALKLVNSNIIGSFWHYAQTYCGARHNGFGWDFTGASNTEELNKLVQSVMIRRLKKDVLMDLPEKTKSFLPIELDNTKEYFAAEKNFISWYASTKGPDAAEKASNAETLVKIEALKQLAVKGKMKQVIEWIQDFLEIDGKLIVFATHKFVIDELMNTFGYMAVKVDGSVTGPQRDAAVQRFQNDESCRLFVGNIKAAGVGLTLTASSNVAFIELPWTPGELVQAEDRAHRIGQKNAVNIHYLLAVATIEVRIAELLDSKRKVLDAVLDGVETDEESLLSALLNSYTEEE